MFLGDVGDASIWKTAIDLRETLAGIRNAHNMFDAFVVPPDLDRLSDGVPGSNTGHVLAASIAAEIQGLQSADIRNVSRSDIVNAIVSMNNAVAQLQSPTGISGNVAPQIAVVATPDTSSPVVNTQSAPVIPTVATTVAPQNLPPAQASNVATVSTPVPTTAAVAPVTPNHIWWFVGGGLGLLYLFRRKGKRYVSS